MLDMTDSRKATPKGRDASTPAKSKDKGKGTKLIIKTALARSLTIVPVVLSASVRDRLLETMQRTFFGAANSIRITKAQRDIQSRPRRLKKREERSVVTGKGRKRKFDVVEQEGHDDQDAKTAGASHADATTEDDSSIFAFKSWVVSGINAVTRLLEKDQLSCVVVAGAIQPAVMVEHLTVLAAHRHARLCVVDNLNSSQLGEMLGLRSSAVIGIRKTSSLPHQGISQLVSFIENNIPVVDLPWSKAQLELQPLVVTTNAPKKA